jgi:transposase
MTAPQNLASLSREDLLALMAEPQCQIAELCAEIEQLKHGGKRQAALSSKGSRVADPQPPGRKPGTGILRYREALPPEEITEPPVDVRVILDTCPLCGRPLAEERVDCAYTPERPARDRR